MPGFDNGVVFANNVDFTGSSVSSGSAQVTSNGQLLIGSAVAPNIRVGTLSASDSSMTVTNGNGTIALGANVLYATLTLSSAQVKNLNATAYEVIAAPGANRAIFVLNVMFKLDYGGTNAFVDGGSAIDLSYNGDYAGSQISSVGGGGFIDQTVTTYARSQINNFVYPSSQVADMNVTIGNLPFAITGNAADDNSLVIGVYYFILTI